MRVSLNWIKRILGTDNLGISNDALVDRLTRCVAEIDDVERLGGNLDGVIIAKVVSAKQHPNADRLTCCVVETGSGEVPVVCGAPNVREGLTVAFATVGTAITMPGKDGEPVNFKIAAKPLRGEASEGMICAEDELGLGSSHDGIMELDESLAAGTPIAQGFGLSDDILVIDNHAINHRPDLWGHLGWAREVAAVLDIPFTSPYDTSWASQAGSMNVAIESSGCSLYCGAEVAGVANSSSPDWMQQLLTAVGLRPLGLLVDITNFIMLELGHPMHAFDRRAIEGSTIFVRDAAEKELMTTLDGKSHELQQGAVLIADQARSLALAGIMGGEGSMVQADTDTIVLEAAVFEPPRIRKTRLALGAATDSSARFEKSLVAAGAPAAINRTIALLKDIHPELTIGGYFSQGDMSEVQQSIAFDANYVNRLSGLELSPEQQLGYLQRLGFTHLNGEITVPWWRTDIDGPADLVEEVLRLHGYEHVAESAPRLPMAVPQRNPGREGEHAIRTALSAAGWNEVATYIFTSEDWANTLNWPEAERIVVSNAPASDQSLMRRNLLAPLADALARNRRHLSSIHMYEIGRIYGNNIGKSPIPDERRVCAGLVINDEESPLYAARDASITAAKALGFTAELSTFTAPEYLIAGRSSGLSVKNKHIGEAGELSTDLRKQLGIEERVGWFCLDLDVIAEFAAAAPVAYKAPSRYQQVEREFTWVCPETTAFAEFDQLTRKAGAKLVRSVDLVTVYRGDPIADGQKAISLKVQLASDDKTLSDKDLAKVSKKIIKTIEHQTSATLRA